MDNIRLTNTLVCRYCNREFNGLPARNRHENYCNNNPNRKKLKPQGHVMTDEVKKKISEGMKKAHAEGRACEWIGRRTRSYAEQSWYNIFIKDFGEGTFENNFFVKKYFLDFAWPEKKIYFEVDGRTHFTENGKKHDLERTEFLQKEGWTLIGRCNWSIYQKLTILEKEKYVKDIENSIITCNIIQNNIMQPNIDEIDKKISKSKIEGRKDKKGRYNEKVLLESEWVEREQLILKSGVDITKRGWISKVMRITKLTKHQVYNVIEHSDFLKSNCYKLNDHIGENAPKFHLDDLKNKRWSIIENSGINFTLVGWSIKLSKLFNISPSQTRKYVKNNFPNFFKDCYQRS